MTSRGFLPGVCIIIISLNCSIQWWYLKMALNKNSSILTPSSGNFFSLFAIILSGPEYLLFGVSKMNYLMSVQVLREFWRNLCFQWLGSQSVWLLCSLGIVLIRSKDRMILNKGYVQSMWRHINADRFFNVMSRDDRTIEHQNFQRMVVSFSWR